MSNIVEILETDKAARHAYNALALVIERAEAEIERNGAVSKRTAAAVVHYRDQWRGARRAAALRLHYSR